MQEIEGLKEIQHWFGRIIQTPMGKDDRIHAITPSGLSIETEAVRYITPNATLGSAQRLEIYNQQYWWRLLHALQETFPLLVLLLGSHRFNQQIAIPYLTKYPSLSWSIVFAGDRLVQWLKEESHDQQWIDAAEIDWAFNISFIAGEHPSLTIADMADETIADQPLTTQPHLVLFKMKYDLFRFKEACSQEPNDYWQRHSLPQISISDHDLFFVLYRNQYDLISWKEISHTEHQLLTLFQQGASINEACDWLEQQEQDEEKLLQWFQEWSARGWLTLYPTFR